MIAYVSYVVVFIVLLVVALMFCFLCYHCPLTYSCYIGVEWSLLMLEHTKQIPARVPVKLIDSCKVAAAKQGISFARYMANIMEENINNDDLEYHISSSLLEIMEKLDSNSNSKESAVLVEVLLLCRAMARAPIVKEIHAVMRQNHIEPTEINNVWG